MRRCAQPSVDHHRDLALGQNNFQKCARGQPLVAADGRAQGHDRGGAGFRELAAQHRVGVNVGQDHEPTLGQRFGGGQGFDGIGHQVLGIGMDFQLEPVGLQSLARKLGGQNGLVAVAHARGIGQQLVALGFEVGKDVICRAVGANPAQRHGHKLRARGGEAVAHERT